MILFIVHFFHLQVLFFEIIIWKMRSNPQFYKSFDSDDSNCHLSPIKYQSAIERLSIIH